MSKHYMDLTTLDIKQIITSEAPTVKEGITYHHRQLGEYLIEIYATKGGERLPASVAVMIDRIEA